MHRDVLTEDHGLEESGRAMAGVVVQQRGAGVQAELVGNSLGEKAQAAWTCPQQ